MNVLKNIVNGNKLYGKYLEKPNMQRELNTLPQGITWVTAQGVDHYALQSHTYWLNFELLI